MLFAFDPRSRYLSGMDRIQPLRRRRGLRGLGEDCGYVPYDGTLTPPDSSAIPIPLDSTPWTILNPTPIATSSSPLPSTLVAPTSGPTFKVPSGLPITAAGQINTAALTAPVAPNIFTGQAIPGLSNGILFAGVAGIVVLMLLSSGGKKKR